jgi:ribokinase
MKIVVLGSFVQACCWKVARLPKAGETFTASALSIEAGGKGLNVAIGTRRLGADVDILLAIGQDAAADALLQLLASEGLSSTYVWPLATQSGYGAGLIADDGQNAIAVFPGPNLLLADTHAQIAKPAILAADLVYGQLETALEAVASAFHIARLAGVRTVLNPSPWQSLPKSLLDDTDILIVNEVEAQALLDFVMPLLANLQDCIALLRPVVNSFWLVWSGSLLVITLGALGSAAFERDGAIHSAVAFEIVAIDSVGAGDAFASALLTGLCRGVTLTDALHYANACGAVMASRLGVLDALPTVEAVQAFLRPAV